jgi:hypothetical protein
MASTGTMKKIFAACKFCRLSIITGGPAKGGGAPRHVPFIASQRVARIAPDDRLREAIQNLDTMIMDCFVRFAPAPTANTTRLSWPHFERDSYE